MCFCAWAGGAFRDSLNRGDGRRSRLDRERSSRDGICYQNDVSDSRRREDGSREKRSYRQSGPVESRRYTDYRGEEEGRGRRGYGTRLPERDRGGRKREYHVNDDGYRDDYYKSLEDGLDSSPGHGCTHKHARHEHDASWDRDEEKSNRRSRSPSPSVGIVIRNLPPDVTEEELKGLFASVPGTAAIEMLDDQWSGKDEGEACAYLVRTLFLLISLSFIRILQAWYRI